MKNYQRYNKFKNQTYLLPGKTFKLKPWRKEKIYEVNDLVRKGFNLKEISEKLNMSSSTISRYYYGYANNCLGCIKVKKNQTLEDLNNIYGDLISSIYKEILFKKSNKNADLKNVYVPYETHYEIKKVLNSKNPIPLERIEKRYYLESSYVKDHELTIKMNKRYGDLIKFEKMNLKKVINYYIKTKRFINYAIMYEGAACKI